MVVCVPGLAPGAGHQRGGGLLHHAVRPEVRQAAVHQLAHLHGGVLCGESVHHPTIEGATEMQIIYIHR